MHEIECSAGVIHEVDGAAVCVDEFRKVMDDARDEGGERSLVLHGLDQVDHQCVTVPNHVRLTEFPAVVKGHSCREIRDMCVEITIPFFTARYAVDMQTHLPIVAPSLVAI